MEFNDLKVEDTNSKLCYMLTYYAKELQDGRGFDLGFLRDNFSAAELSKMDEPALCALSMRNELYFYEMFIAYDKMYQYLVSKKVIKVPDGKHLDEAYEIPVEFVKALLETTLSSKEMKKYPKERLRKLYQYMGDSLFMYYQGLLYEYYCDTKNKEFTRKLNNSVYNLLSDFESKDEVTQTLEHRYLFDDEAVDQHISIRFQEVMEKIQWSEKYGKLLSRNLEVIRKVRSGINSTPKGR